MFDTMNLTKVVLGFCGTFLVFLLGGWAAELIYHTGGGHGGEEHAQGYMIEVEEAAGGEEVVEVAFADVLATADAGKGAKVFGKCKACHKLEEGANATGPYLYGVVNRPVGSAEGYSYSGSLVAVADVWTPENLNHFLTNPKGFAPGTAMGFAGLKKIQDRANLIAYLETIGG